MTCVVDGCNRRVLAKGLCSAHYARLHKYGSVDGRGRQTNAEWLAGLVGHVGDECVPWPFGTDSDGYGNVQFEGKQVGAHRAICIMAHGLPPTTEHQAAHSCGNGKHGCVNPNHVRWSTPIENIHEKQDHGTQCAGETHPSAKLTAAQVAEIRSSEARTGLLAANYGVNPSTIYAIRSGKHWKRERHRTRAA